MLTLIAENKAKCTVHCIEAERKQEPTPEGRLTVRMPGFEEGSEAYSCDFFFFPKSPQNICNNSSWVEVLELKVVVVYHRDSSVLCKRQYARM